MLILNEKKIDKSSSPTTRVSHVYKIKLIISEVAPKFHLKCELVWMNKMQNISTVSNW